MRLLSFDVDVQRNTTRAILDKAGMFLMQTTASYIEDEVITLIQ